MHADIHADIRFLVQKFSWIHPNTAQNELVHGQPVGDIDVAFMPRSLRRIRRLCLALVFHRNGRRQRAPSIRDTDVCSHERGKNKGRMIRACRAELVTIAIVLVMESNTLSVCHASTTDGTRLPMKMMISQKRKKVQYRFTLHVSW